MRDEHFAKERKILKFYICVFVGCFIDASFDTINQFLNDET